jgi:GntR family transcriptional regulator
MSTARDLATAPPEAALRRGPTGGERAKPLYEQIDNMIRQRLIDNLWKPGSAIPSEMQLAAEFNVSQGTVRKALNDLVAENLLYRRQGLGTFVSEHTDRRALFLYFSLVGKDGTRELPQSRKLSSRRGPASAIERERLELARGAAVIRHRRLRFLGGRPTIVETVTVPQDLFPGLGDKGVTLPNHLYRFYESEYGITVVRAREHTGAVAAGAEEADLLELAPGAPLLEIDRIALTLDARPVEWRLSRCETSRYHYFAERG